MNSIIKIQNLSYSIPYSKNIYQDINLDLNPGEIIGILGVNGSGKTTLIDIILGHRTNYDGVIEVIGENLKKSERKNLNQIAFISQDITLPGIFTITEYTEFLKEFYPFYDINLEHSLLKRFGLSGETKIGSLSTGQQRKVQIIAAISAKPKLLIIDEITAVLDPETRDIFFNVLIESKNNFNLSVILATNIAEDLIHTANKIFFIKDNKITIQEPNQIMKLFNLENKHE